MPTRNVNLTDELDRLVLARIESGCYENASEVVRTALRSLESEEQEYETKVAALRTAIDEGHPFTRVRATLKLSKKRHSRSRVPPLSPHGSRFDRDRPLHLE